MGVNKYPTTTIRIKPEFKDEVLETIKRVNAESNGDLTLKDAVIEALEMWIKSKE